MSKTGKVVLGIVTSWPVAYVPIFVAFWIYQAVFVFSESREQHGAALGTIAFFVLHGLTMIVGLALCFIYLVHMFGNDRIPDDKKPHGAILLLFGGMVAAPIYWYLYIWPDRADQPSQPSYPGQRLPTSPGNDLSGSATH